MLKYPTSSKACFVVVVCVMNLLLLRLFGGVFFPHRFIIGYPIRYTAARTSILSPCEANTLEEGSGYKFRVREDSRRASWGRMAIWCLKKYHPICIVSSDRITSIYKLNKKARNWGDLRSLWRLTSYESWDDPPMTPMTSNGPRRNAPIQISMEQLGFRNKYHHIFGRRNAFEIHKWHFDICQWNTLKCNKTWMVLNNYKAPVEGEKIDERSMEL